MKAEKNGRSWTQDHEGQVKEFPFELNQTECHLLVGHLSPRGKMRYRKVAQQEDQECYSRNSLKKPPPSSIPIFFRS